MASWQSRLLKAYYRRLKLFQGEDFDLAEMRRRTDSVARVSPPHRRVTISPVTIGGISAEWHMPYLSGADGVMLYLHGGAWFLGSTASHRAFISKLTYLAGVKTLAINYRLAPEHPFPAGLEDCIAAFQYLVESGFPPRKIVVAGDSAGGNLTLALLLALRDRGEPLPGAAVGISPATDLTGSGDSYQTRAAVDPLFGQAQGDFIMRWYAGDAPLEQPLLSPLFGDLHGLPSLLLHVGDHEILLDDTLQFAEKAREAGVAVTAVVWPQMFHVFHMFASFLPEARRANREIAAFIREKLA